MRGSTGGGAPAAAGAGRHVAARAGRRRAGPAARAERRHRDARRPRLGELRGDRALQAGLRRRGRRSCWSRASSTRTVLTADLGRVLAARGLPRRATCRDNEKGLGSLPPVCREIAELDPAQGRVRRRRPSSTRRSAQIGDEFARRQQAQPAQAQSAGRGRRGKLSKRRGDPPAEQRAPGERGRRRGDRRSSHNRRSGWRLRYGLTGIPRIDNPDFVSTARVRPGARRACPKSRFAYLFPVEERGADPGPAASPG